MLYLLKVGGTCICQTAKGERHTDHIYIAKQPDLDPDRFPSVDLYYNAIRAGLKSAGSYHTINKRSCRVGSGVRGLSLDLVGSSGQWQTGTLVRMRNGK